MQTFENIDDLTERIIGCAIEVHRILGPGLLESVYRQCLLLELRAANLKAESARRVPIIYKGHELTAHLELDVLVEGRVVIELKAVDRLQPVFSAQGITYLKLSGCPAGLLLNFNATTLRAGLKRLDHPDVRATRVGQRGTSDKIS